MPPRQSHLVVVAGPGWGHVKACVLAALTFVHQSKCIHATLVAFPDTFPKLDQEMKQQGHVSNQVLDRMQWFEIQPNGPEGSSAEALLQAYEDLFKGLMLPSSPRPGRFDLQPSLVIYDTAAETTPTPRMIRRIAEQASVPYVPCFYMASVLSGGCLRLSGKEEYGGRYELFEHDLARFEKEGMDPSEANRRAYVRMEGKLLETSDLPPIYDHELHPGVYGRSFPARIGPRVRAVLAGRHSDGYISFGTPEIEPLSTDLLRKSLSPVALYTIGSRPHIDLQRWNAQAPSIRNDWSSAEKSIIDFLDGQLRTSGARSIVYFCLGSQWWPDNRPELIRYLVESLVEAEPPLPFLISAPASAAGITDDLRAQVESTRRGMIVSWAPQWSVLQHEAVRIFISHCGSASSIEAIMATVPIVASPFTADQPIWATLLCRVFGAGIQLHQVNSGMKGKPLGAGGIVHETEDAIKAEMKSTWRIMRSERYDDMRQSMGRLRGTILDSAEKGEVKKAIDDIVQKYLS